VNTSELSTDGMMMSALNQRDRTEAVVLVIVPCHMDQYSWLQSVF
jgi:hypothetical protein